MNIWNKYSLFLIHTLTYLRAIFGKNFIDCLKSSNIINIRITCIKTGLQAIVQVQPYLSQYYEASKEVMEGQVHNRAESNEA